MNQEIFDVLIKYLRDNAEQITYFAVHLGVNTITYDEEAGRP